MDSQSVDNMLMNSFGLNEMGNIDADKYPKGVFSPSSKNEEATAAAAAASRPQKVSSPQKSISPHPVPHFQHPLAAPQAQHTSLPRMSPVPQANFQQQPHHHHMPQRKVHLGPNFDRLGILNQANEIPPMSAPYFAKALQQQGGGTLGAILQAHQHALQQQMQRESFLLQQAVHQQMFQNVPFNMYHQQRMGSIMMDRRTDDQIVPNAQMVPPHENWLKHPAHPSPRKRMKRKHDDVDNNDRRKGSNYKDVSDMSEKYVIFNDENHVNQLSEDECSSPRIAPPKDSVFVRYPTNSCKTLPSFSDAFSGHIEKLKLKEQHLKESLLRHGVNEQMIPDLYPTSHTLPDDGINQQMLPDDIVGQQMLPTQCSQQEILPSTNPINHLHPDINETLDPLAGIVDQLLPDGILPDSEDQKTETEEAESGNKSTAHKDVESQLKEDETISQNDVNKTIIDENENINTDIKIDNDSTLVDENSQMDYLNDITGKIGEKTDKSSDSSQKSNENKEGEDKEKTETFPSDNEDIETQNATNNINIFEEDLDLDTDNRNYDNLFNGNSDEHYFQAFKENNLHLIGDLNENKVDGGDDILKLLHSPLDFLNDKFLR